MSQAKSFANAGLQKRSLPLIDDNRKKGSVYDSFD